MIFVGGVNKGANIFYGGGGGGVGELTTRAALGFVHSQIYNANMQTYELLSKLLSK